MSEDRRVLQADEDVERDERDGRADRLSVGSALVALGFGLGTALAVIAAARLLTSSLVILSFLFEIAFLAGVVAYLSSRRVNITSALRLGPVPASVYWPALKLALALLIANAAAATLLGPPAREAQFVAEAETVLEQIALVAAVVVAAPLVEEALFRGLIQRVVETRLHHWIAIAVAGVMFGSLHGPESGLFFVFWSLPVGWITWRSGSIRPAVAVHALNNVVGLVLLLTLGGGPPPARPELTASAIALALAALGLMAVWSVGLCAQLARRLERASPAAPKPM